MMKQHLLWLFLALPLGAFAQGRDISIKTERGNKGEVSFFVENTSYIPYTVSITFQQLNNTTTIPAGGTQSVLARRGRTRLITLRPATPGNVTYSSPRIVSRKGDINAKVDSTFTYLFPMPPGGRVKAGYMSSISGLVSGTQGAFVGLAFWTAEGDTITAARAGKVIAVHDGRASDQSTVFTATENHVEVYHKDGSIAFYKLFRDGGIFVEPGDDIIPGQPLGITGGSNYKGGSHLRFALMDPSNPGYHFVPCFYLGEGKIAPPVEEMVYKSEHPRELILLELSKKERKKLGE